MSVIRLSFLRKSWFIACSLCGLLLEDRFVHVLDDFLEALFAEELDPEFCRIQDGERRLEQVLQLDPAAGDAAVLEKREILRLLRRERLGNQPGLEVFRQFLLARFDLQTAEGGLDEIDQVATGLAVGAAKILLVEIHLRLVEPFGQCLLFVFRQEIAAADLLDDWIVLHGGSEHSSPNW